MLFPIGDDNTDRQSFPFVNIALIIINVLVFIYQLSHPEFTYGYSVVPIEIATGTDINGLVRVGGASLRLFAGPEPVYLTLLSSMFIHGGWMHLLGNMLYLWIFGDNVEDRMGHAKYLIFYLLCGVLASFTHIFFAIKSVVPSLGASGAIAGVLGAYLILFPKRPIKVLVFGSIIAFPAIIVIGLWGLLQFINGFGSLASIGRSGGTAYMAHVGGFVAGLVLVFLFSNSPYNRNYRDYGGYN